MHKDSLLQYLPSLLADVREIKEIMTSITAEIKRLETAAQKASDNQFIQTADTGGVARWEQSLKIAPKSTDTEERRFEIETRLNEQRPYSYKAIRSKLEKLCGADGYSVSRDAVDKTLTVRVELTAAGNLQSVSDMLDRIVPANMVIDLSLMYNQYQDYADKTYSGMTAYTHNQLRNEVIA